MKRRWKEQVHELDSRLARCSQLIDQEFQIDQNKKCGPEMSNSSHTVEKVVSDKNTIVQITVHSKPKESQPTKKSEPRYLEKKSESRSLDARQEKKTEVRDRKKPASRSPRRTKKTHKENIEPEEDKSNRSVPDLIQELREVIKTSGIKDVYEFLHEFEGGNERRKSAPETRAPPMESKEVNTSLKSAKTVSESEMRENAREEKAVKTEMNRLKGELNRYKKEYEISLQKMRISQETNEGLNSQILEMKQLITKLTSNNKNLVQLISDRASQEERLVEVENQNAQLSSQLEKEKATIACYEIKFREQEEEIVRLKCLTADIRAQLNHGLEGLDQPRPGSSLPPNLLNRTKDILGQTIYKPSQRMPNIRQDSHSPDSAIEDPTSESRSLPRPVFHPPPPPKHPPPPRRNPPSSTGTPSTQPPPSSNQSTASRPAAPVETFRTAAAPLETLRTAAAPFETLRASAAPPPYYTHSPPTRQVSGDSVHRFNPSIQTEIFRPSFPTSENKSSGAKTPVVPLPGSNQVPQSVFTSTTIGATVTSLPGGTVTSRQASRNLFSVSSRSRNSTLIHSILQSQPSHPSADVTLTSKPPVSGVDPEFRPVPLALEETASPDELDGSSGLTKSTPATVVERGQRSASEEPRVPGVERINEEIREEDVYTREEDVYTREENVYTREEDVYTRKENVDVVSNRKESLENKVQAFLNRLHQESLNYTLPQAKSFEGPSFHLSLSGGENDEDMSRETTLTEGKFRRGLETSIEILPQEFSVSRP